VSSPTPTAAPGPVACLLRIPTPGRSSDRHPSTPKARANALDGRDTAPT
jgi:hypothetical protein